MKHLAYESDKPQTEEFARGVEAVRFIRCMKHREDSQLNFEADGCECAVCEVKSVAAVLRRAAPEKALAPDKDHGTWRVACICPGCLATVPGCWQTPMCMECAHEDCEHPEASEAPAPDLVGELVEALRAVAHSRNINWYRGARSGMRLRGR